MQLLNSFRAQRGMRFATGGACLFFLCVFACNNSSEPKPSAPPDIQFSLASQSVSEGAGTVLIAAQLSASSKRDVTVFFTVAGTAVAGADFATTAPSITIAAGSINGEIAINLIDDTIGECNENIIVTLDSVANAVISGLSVCAITILDNDTAPIPGDGLTVISPNGCETYYVGDTMEIYWDIPTKRNLLQIDFSSNNGLSFLNIAQIYTSNANYAHGPFRWVIPDTLCSVDLSECYSTVSDSCQITIHEYFSPPFNDKSDRIFSIKARQ